MILVSLGSNLGDIKQNLNTAVQYLQNTDCTIITISNLFETESWTKDGQNNYFNQIININTSLSPQQLLSHLLEIEKKMGRVRQKKWEERIIDLDILFFNNQIIDEENLKIPHPHLHTRNFILDILIDMKLKKLVHPVFNKTILQLKQQCEDMAQVKKIYF